MRRSTGLVVVAVLVLPVLWQPPVLASSRAVTRTGVAAAAVRDPDAARSASLATQLDKYLATREGVVSVAFRYPTSGRTFVYAPGRRFDTASIAKLDLLVVLELRHQRTRTQLTAEEKRLARVMIGRSDNAAATRLFRRIGGAKILDRWNKRLGLRDTVASQRSWGLTRTSAADQVRLLRVLTASDSPMHPDRRSYVRRLMTKVVPSQAWGVTAASDPRTDPPVKNGWKPSRPGARLWIVNSIGVVEVDGRNVEVAVLTRRNPSMRHGQETIRTVARMLRPTVRASIASARR